MRKPLTVAALALASALAAAPALCDSTRAGDFTVHATAFSSESLSPEIARRIGLTRAGNRAVLNVSVVKEQAGTLGVSSTALVEAWIVKPEGMQGRIPMREIRDGNAVAYLGEFPLESPATVDFEIQVRPAGASEIPTIRLSQELFAE